MFALGRDDVTISHQWRAHVIHRRTRRPHHGPRRYRIDSFTTDSQGVLSLPGSPAADYWVWAERHPGGAELVDPVPAPPALGGGRRGGISRGAQRALELRGQDDASLVISEFSYALLPVSVFGDRVNYWSRSWRSRWT